MQERRHADGDRVQVTSDEAIGPAGTGRPDGEAERWAAERRVAEAERLLLGLAIRGSPAHGVLLAAGPDERSADPAACADALEALAEQARISRRAAEHAVSASTGELHWLVDTSHEWQCYVRWLLSTSRALAARFDGAHTADRDAVVAAWRVAEQECEAARRHWGALVPRGRA